MNFAKKYFKIFVGIAALILVLVVFFFVQRSSDLETGSMRDWRAAPVDRKIAAAQILTGADENIDMLVACINKIASLPDSNEMAIRDAASLCHTGLQIKENL